MPRTRSVLLLAFLCLLPAAAFAAGIPIRGRVLDSGGAALAKAKVRLVPIPSSHADGLLELEGKDGPEAVASVETAADGSFHLEAPEAGMWTVIAGGPGLVSQMRLIIPLLAERDLPAVRLQRDAGLTVRVTGPDGKPVPGARVRTQASRPKPRSDSWYDAPGFAVTDAEGKAVLPREASAAVTVRAGRSGLVTERKEVRAGTLELRLDAVQDIPVRVVGADGKPVADVPAAVEVPTHVVSATDGRPVAGALVWRMDDPGGFRRTGARGEARLPAPVGETITFQAAATGFFSMFQEFRSAADPPRQPLTLSLQPDLTITGVVVDEAGAPVAGAEITASQAFQARGALVRSGPDGRFRWGGLAAGMEVELRAAKDGFAPIRVQATPPSPDRPAAPLRIVLQQGRSAFGRLLGPDQRPIAGAQVTLRTSRGGDSRARLRAALEPGSLDTFETVTRAEGRFDLGNLPAGRYDLTARSRGWAPLTVPGLEVPQGNQATDLGTLVLARGVALEGAVVDAAGKPVEGAEIRLSEAGDFAILGFHEESDESKGLSGADGFFRIEDLRAGSTVDVSVARPGYAPGSAQGVRVPTEQPLRIALQAVGSISGRVVDPDGNPIAGAIVQVDILAETMALTPLRSMPPLDRSDTEGRFRLTDVTPGPLGVAAQAPGWQNGSVADLELRGGEDKRGVEIVLSPAAVLEGSVLSPSGRVLPGAQVHLLPEENRGGGFHMATANGDGHYVLDSLPPGQRTVEAMHPEHGTARRQVELRIGENALDITLDGGSEVSGRVIDDSGAPVAGAQVWIASEGTRRPLSTMSQIDGTFRLAAVADGSYRAGADKDGFARAEMVPVTVDGSSVAGIELRLTRGGAIVGRITGIEISELSRVQVQVQSPGRGLAIGGRVEPDGSYRIDHLKEGEWRVRAELPGTALYAQGVARLEPGASEARLDLDMERGFELAGRVRRNGAPVPDAPIFLEGAKRTMGATDGDGRFRFQGLSAGTYRLLLGDRSTFPRHEETVDLQGDRNIIIDLPAANAPD